MFEYVNTMGAIGAIFALVCIACRADQLVWRVHQGRFIIANVMVACYAVSLILHLWGRDNLDWYSIFGISCVCLILVNQVGEWAHGVPTRMLRSAPMMELPGPEFSWDRKGKVKFPSVHLSTYAIPHGIADAISLTILVVSLSLASALYQAGHGQPVNIFGGRANPPVIEVGEPLNLVWDIQRFRDCPGEIRQFLLDDKGAHVTTLLPRSAGRNMVSPRTERTVRIDLPVLIPGEFVYRANLRSECADGTYSVWAPDVSFSVVAFKGSKEKK